MNWKSLGVPALVAAAIASGSQAGPLGPHGQDWTGSGGYVLSGVFDGASCNALECDVTTGPTRPHDPLFVGPGDYIVKFTTEAPLLELILMNRGERHYDYLTPDGTIYRGDGNLPFDLDLSWVMEDGVYVSRFSVPSTLTGVLCCDPLGPGEYIYEEWNRTVILFEAVYRPQDVGKAWTLSVQRDAVPEPATWAMLIVGFAVTGSMLRRRVGVA